MNISECYITIVLRGFVLLGLFRLHLFCCSLPTSIILKYSKTKMDHQNVSKIIHQRTYLVFAKQTSNSKLDFVSNSWQEAHKYVEMWGEEEGSDTKLMTFLRRSSQLLDALWWCMAWPLRCGRARLVEWGTERATQRDVHQCHGSRRAGTDATRGARRDTEKPRDGRPSLPPPPSTTWR